MYINNIVKKFEIEKRNKPFVTGIDGLGGTGKTTFAQELKHHLEMQREKVVLLHMDDFIYPRNVRYDGDEEEWRCYYEKQWRFNYLIETIFIPLQLGKTIDQTIEIYDRKNDGYQLQPIHIDSKTILLIEGMFIQRQKLKPYFDFVIFLDVPKDIRLERVLKRDTYIGNREEIATKYERRYFPAEEYYLARCSPIVHADKVKVYTKIDH